MLLLHNSIIYFFSFFSRTNLHFYYYFFQQKSSIDKRSRFLKIYTPLKMNTAWTFHSIGKKKNENVDNEFIILTDNVFFSSNEITFFILSTTLFRCK